MYIVRKSPHGYSVFTYELESLDGMIHTDYLGTP